MLTEIDSDYPLKYDLLRNYVSELIHYALKLRPSDALYQHPDARSRLTAVFIELLERQFPIGSTARRFSVRSASDFARQLAVHVNHLNRCVRDTTGKTTLTTLPTAWPAKPKHCSNIRTGTLPRSATASALMNRPISTTFLKSEPAWLPRPFGVFELGKYRLDLGKSLRCSRAYLCSR